MSSSQPEQPSAMPDGLATLVALSIRDRVVLEQMEEIRLLKARLARSDAVEVTGPGGWPVYARGDFTGGDFCAYCSPSEGDEDDGGSPDGDGEHDDGDKFRAFWDVGLEMTPHDSSSSSHEMQMSNTMPLEELANVEIRVGGTLYASSTQDVGATSAAFGIRPGNKFDLVRCEDMSRSVVAELGAEEGDNTRGDSHRGATLTFHVPDLPREAWNSLRSAAVRDRSEELGRREAQARRDEMRREVHRDRQARMEAAGQYEYGFEDENETDEEDEDEEDDDYTAPMHSYNYLTKTLASRHPGRRANISSVSLCISGVRGRIEALSGRGEDFDKLRARAIRGMDAAARRRQVQAAEAESAEEF